MHLEQYILEKLHRIESLIQNKKEKNLMTINDIVIYSGLSDSTIRRGLKKRTLKPIKDEGKKLFRKIDVDNWIEGK